MARKVFSISLDDDQISLINGYAAESGIKQFSTAAKNLMMLGLSSHRHSASDSESEEHNELMLKLLIESLMIQRVTANDASPEQLKKAQTMATRYYQSTQD